ncbi:MAG TPA: TonB family protein [bacterium]|nr:TonB family protein [bacterium]
MGRTDSQGAMDLSFWRSLGYSALLHALLLALLFWVYQSFLVVHTPLMMDLTLIGQMSQGNGLGSLATQAGTQPQELPKAATEGEFGSVSQPQAQPEPPSSPRPEVSVKRPPKPVHHAGKASQEAYLEHLSKEAPIGLENRKNETAEIKTTAGLGHMGTAGAPEGSPNIEGELAARAIKRRVDPAYPDWARKQGIEAMVKFRMVVLPNGLLKENELQLEQTSGYRELDRVVYEALIQWEFEPLSSNLPQADQSGVITFSFDLKD